MMKPRIPVLALLAATTAAFMLARAQAAPSAQAAASPPARHTPAGAATSATVSKHAAEPALPANAERISHGRFEDLIVYRPAGAPTSVVLLLSGEGGWTAAAADMAQALVDEGALVVGIDTPRLVAAFDQDGGDCVYPDGDLENLSRFVQAYYRLPGYFPPLLVGYSAGATLAYGTLAQASPGTFGGALSLAFCPDLEMRTPLCRGAGLESTHGTAGRGIVFQPARQLADPWIVMQGGIDQVCEAAVTQKFVSQVPHAEILVLPKVGHAYSVPANWMAQYKSTFAKLVREQKPSAQLAPPADLAGLPIIEIPAKTGTAQRGSDEDVFALLISGDGGWAGLDRDVADALSAHGIPVIGLDSLRYYWTPRTPESTAADIDRILRYYIARFGAKQGKKRALLIGYSQGADVLPFVLNRLPAATRQQLALGALIGLSERALFEFHMTSWVSESEDGLPTLPEMSKLGGSDPPVLCLYGEEEDDSPCPKLDPQKFKLVRLKGGHHFDGDYDRLAQEILKAARQDVGQGTR
jgi:type IV secretory pathway VirJ component